MVDVPAKRGQHLLEGFRLGHRAREAVQDETRLTVWPLEAPGDDADDQRVRDQLARLHQRLGLKPERGPLLHCLAENVTGGHLRRAVRGQQSPGAARAGEALVVAGDEVALDLLDRVERHADDDEQRRPAEVEANPEAPGRMRDHADHREIDGPTEGDPRQHLSMNSAVWRPGRIPGM